MLKRLIPDHLRGQFLRYVVVGTWNTLFGYGCFFLLVRFFLHFLPAQPALTASIAFIVATVINVTVSFLGYKWFVFRTQGNYLREYRRSLLVYLPSLALSAVAIAPLTGLLRLVPHLKTQAPYVAGAALAGFNVIASFLGHKHISFKTKLET
ncbi:MAG: putative rane protein [Edaphobacter sp.]|jgi:putative flippase GtrA|nr:putative rane protein [Edaphobacter sp.]